MDWAFEFIKKVRGVRGCVWAAQQQQRAVRACCWVRSWRRLLVRSFVSLDAGVAGSFAAARVCIIALRTEALTRRRTGATGAPGAWGPGASHAARLWRACARRSRQHASGRSGSSVDDVNSHPCAAHVA